MRIGVHAMESSSLMCESVEPCCYAIFVPYTTMFILLTACGRSFVDHQRTRAVAFDLNKVNACYNDNKAPLTVFLPSRPEQCLFPSVTAVSHFQHAAKDLTSLTLLSLQTITHHTLTAPHQPWPPYAHAQTENYRGRSHRCVSHSHQSIHFQAALRTPATQKPYSNTGS